MFESSSELPTGTKGVADAIEALAAGLAAGTAKLLALISEFDGAEMWREWGSTSTVDWLAWRCGVSRMTAREYVRVARALRRLPHVAAAFTAGRLSYSKVRAITRIAHEENESRLLASALSCTAAQLERLVRSARRGAAVEDPSYALKNRSVRRWTDDDGMIAMLARFAPDDGEIVWRALQITEDAAGVSAETEDDALRGAPPAERRRADALVDMARAVIGGIQGRRSSVLAVVHVDSRDGSIRTSDETQIAAATAERLLCDAALVRVAHHPSGLMDVGRATRVIPAALRRALEARDPCCQFPGCSNTRYLQAHHYKPFSRGGETSQENCGLFCPYHHRLLHEGGWILMRDDGGVVAARSPNGFVVHRRADPPGLPQMERAVGWP